MSHDDETARNRAPTETATMPKTNDTSPDFQLVLTPDKAALASDGPTTLRLLVRVQAPDLPGRHRCAPAAAPRAGARPLGLHGRGAAGRGQALRAQHDRRSGAGRPRGDLLVRRRNREVAPLTPATDKLALAAALAGIQSGGSTNLHGGWHAGAEELARQLAGDDVHRVILLSDGGANAGETDLEEIARQCKVFAQRGVSTSTYGLGEQFNEQ